MQFSECVGEATPPHQKNVNPVYMAKSVKLRHRRRSHVKTHKRAPKKEAKRAVRETRRVQRKAHHKRRSNEAKKTRKAAARPKATARPKAAARPKATARPKAVAKRRKTVGRRRRTRGGSIRHRLSPADYMSLKNDVQIGKEGPTIVVMSKSDQRTDSDIVKGAEGVGGTVGGVAALAAGYKARSAWRQARAVDRALRDNYGKEIGEFKTWNDSNFTPDDPIRMKLGEYTVAQDADDKLWYATSKADPTKVMQVTKEGKPLAEAPKAEPKAEPEPRSVDRGPSPDDVFSEDALNRLATILGPKYKLVDPGGGIMKKTFVRKTETELAEATPAAEKEGLPTSSGLDQEEQPESEPKQQPNPDGRQVDGADENIWDQIAGEYYTRSMDPETDPEKLRPAAQGKFDASDIQDDFLPPAARFMDRFPNDFDTLLEFAAGRDEGTGWNREVDKLTEDPYAYRRGVLAEANRIARGSSGGTSPFDSAADTATEVDLFKGDLSSAMKSIRASSESADTAGDDVDLDELP